MYYLQFLVSLSVLHNLLNVYMNVYHTGDACLCCTAVGKHLNACDRGAFPHSG